MTESATIDTGIDRTERARVTRRVTLVGAIMNLLLALVKTLFGFIGHSHALIADGIHSLSDLLSDGLVFFAAHHSHQEPDEQHPYGHGRFETAATLGLSLLLILVAVGLIWDATERLFSPEKLLQPTQLTLWVALVSVLSKEWLYHYTRIAANRINSDMMRANAWHHRSDAVSSVVVLVGLAGTMAGLPYLDAIAAIGVGLMIAKIGWELGWGSMQELVDTGLSAERIAAIRDTIHSVGGVVDIHMLRTRRIGTSASADVHVLVEPKLSVSEGHMISLMVEQRLKREIDEITDVTVHIDPEDDEKAPNCQELPMRADALRILKERWAAIDDVAGAERIVFHYLSGKIDVDVYLPLLASVSEQQTRSLGAVLHKALEEVPEFGTVTVYFG